MGAQVFEQYQKGENVLKAFNEAVEDALYEYGHGGYTGTLAEKGEYTIIQPEPLSPDQAHELADKLIDNDDPRITDKWGPAGAIPVGENGKTEGWLFFGWASS